MIIILVHFYDFNVYNVWVLNATLFAQLQVFKCWCCFCIVEFYYLSTPTLCKNLLRSPVQLYQCSLVWTPKNLFKRNAQIRQKSFGKLFIFNTLYRETIKTNAGLILIASSSPMILIHESSFLYTLMVDYISIL